MTAPTITTDTDTRPGTIPVPVDLDAEVSCVKCERTALWVASCVFCGVSAILCNRHRAEFQRWLARTRGVCICNDCGRGKRLAVDLVRWRPL